MAQGMKGIVRRPGPISVHELAALNEEIAALVRAGVPLDRGLLRAGGELSRRAPANHPGAGPRLTPGRDALPGPGGRAGSRSPRSTARWSRPGPGRGGCPRPRGAGAIRARLLGGSAAIGVALWYPILVLSLAYLLFLGLVIEVIPRFIGAFESLGLTVIAPLRWLERIGELAPYWWPVWPVLLVLLGLAWWRSGVAATFQTSTWSLMRLFPWMSSMLSDYESAGFTELMALLLDHRVAYPQAVTLAAEATGNAAMMAGAQQIAAAVERGEPAARAVAEVARAGLPALAPLGAGGGSRTGLARRVAAQPRADVSQARGLPGREAADLPADGADAVHRRLGHAALRLDAVRPPVDHARRPGHPSERSGWCLTVREP